MKYIVLECFEKDLEIQATDMMREPYILPFEYICNIFCWFTLVHLNYVTKAKAKSFTSQVAHGAGTYFRFL